MNNSSNHVILRDQEGPEEEFDPQLLEQIKQYNSKKAQSKDSIMNHQDRPLKQGEEDLVDMSRVDQLFRVCHNLPKIELHCHIGGSVRPQTFMDMVMKRNVNIDHIDFYNINLKTAFEIFEISSKLIDNSEVLKRVTCEIIEDYSKQNCRYLELRSTPKEFGSETRENYIWTIISAIEEMAPKIPTLKVKYIASVNRNYSADVAKEVVDLLAKIRDEQKAKGQEPSAIGIELSGDPRSGEFEKFKPHFRKAQELGFKTTLHCAECKEQKQEAQEMIDFKPDRLGHCIYLSKQQIKQVSEMGIPVEVCPTSNVASTQCSLASFLPHIKEFETYNHNTIICCDDTLLFNTNLSMELFEFSKAVEQYDTAVVKEKLIRNVDAIFYDNSDYKQALKDELRTKY